MQIFNGNLTTLAVAITSAGQTTGIKVAAIPGGFNNTSGVPALASFFTTTGTLQESLSFLGYTGTGPYTLTGVVRGVEGTATTYANGAQVAIGAATANALLSLPYLLLSGGTLSGNINWATGSSIEPDNAGGLNLFDSYGQNLSLRYGNATLSGDLNWAAGSSIEPDGAGGLNFEDSYGQNLNLTSGNASFSNNVTVLGSVSVSVNLNLGAAGGGGSIEPDGAGGLNFEDSYGQNLNLTSGNATFSNNVIVLGSVSAAGGFYTKAGTLAAKSGGSLFEKFTDLSNTTSTSIQDLYSHTLPAGLLANNGDKIRFVTAFNIASNTRTKTVGITAFGTQIYTDALTISVAGTVTVDVIIIRVSATSVRCLAYPTMATAIGTTTPVVTDITGLTLTGTNILKSTCTIGTGSTAGDVTAKMDIVEYLPYSGN